MITFDPITHTYIVKGVKYPSVTEIIGDMGLYGDVSYFTEYSRERGNFVHWIIEWYLEGTLDEATIDPELLPYFHAWQRFEADTHYESEVCEKVIASDSLRFAGTIDHIGYLNGHFCIIDVKTGVMAPATAIQLAGYEVLAKQPGIKRFALQLTGEGKYKLTEFKDRQDAQIFKAALAIYWWKQNNLKGRG
jgi:hypothetical protein